MSTFKTLLVGLVLLMSACMAASAQEVGRVDSDRYVTVVHDTTGRRLTEPERKFLATVPSTGGLRAAVAEMLLARVVHVPESGRYRPDNSVHYWSIYQAWTGSAKVRVPVFNPAPVIVRPAAAPPVNITNISYNLSPAVYPSAQMLGPMAPMVISTQLGGIQSVAQYRINATATGGTATGGAGGAATATQSQQQQQQQQQQQEVTITP